MGLVDVGSARHARRMVVRATTVRQTEHGEARPGVCRCGLTQPCAMARFIVAVRAFYAAPPIRPRRVRAQRLRRVSRHWAVTGLRLATDGVKGEAA